MVALKTVFRPTLATSTRNIHIDRAAYRTRCDLNAKSRRPQRHPIVQAQGIQTFSSGLMPFCPQCAERELGHRTLLTRSPHPARTPASRMNLPDGRLRPLCGGRPG